MAEGRLTLNKVIKGTVSSSKGDKVAVEVKRKRSFGESAPVNNASQSSTTIQDEKATAIQELLNKARQTEEAAKAQNEILSQANKTRDMLIEEKRKEEELKQQQILQSNQQKENTAKENKNQDQEDENKNIKTWGKDSKDKKSSERFEEDETKYKKQKSSEKDKSERHKLTLSKVMYLNEDNEDEADEEDTQQQYRRFSQYKKRKSKDDSAKQKAPAEKIIKEVVLYSTISVKDLAEKMSEKSATVIKELMKLGIMATINQVIDADTAELVVMELGHKIKRINEDAIEQEIKTSDTGTANFLRPPVITIMGHVDHGKTSLLDAIRQTDVAGKESGGITQHIGAYQIAHGPDKKLLTFIDTPGHEAFSQMRARGANVTDIVVLVVAANDSIMPQTIESISHAKSAGVPIIVAINKIDLPDANINRVKTDLLKHEVVVEEMGGDTLCVEVSAKAKIGLDKLIDNILLQSEILDLNVQKERPAEGVIIESKMEKGRGIVATVLVQKGTLKKGDIFVCGESHGRIREMLNDHGQVIDTANPSCPVAVLGFSQMPSAGDEFIVVDSEAKAKSFAAYKQQKAKEKELMLKSKSNLENLFAGINDGEKATVSIILKTDVGGSGEAIIGILNKLNSEKASVKIIHNAVGGINESDINLAKSTNGIIVAFNVRANTSAKELAKSAGIEIRYYSIIYQLVDDIKMVLEGKLKPIITEEFIGYADVLQTFKIGKSLTVAGCKVSEGIVKRNCKCRLIRDDVVIFEGNLNQLKHEKNDIKEASKGTECGISFEGYNDIKIGDKIECFEVVQTAAKL